LIMNIFYSINNNLEIFEGNEASSLTQLNNLFCSSHRVFLKRAPRKLFSVYLIPTGMFLIFRFPAKFISTGKLMK